MKLALAREKNIYIGAHPKNPYLVFLPAKRYDRCKPRAGVRQGAF